MMPKMFVQAMAIGAFVIVVIFLGLVLWRSLFPSDQTKDYGNSAQAQQQNAAKSNKGETGETLWQRTTNDPVAFFTLWLAVFTSLLVLVSTFQIGFLISANRTAAKAAKAAENAANAAIESNSISRTAMIAEQRPWVSVDAEVAGPLAFSAEGWDAGVRWHIPLKYRLHNLGKTPATNVSFFAQIIPFTISHWPVSKVKDGIPQGQPIPGTDIAKEFEAVCGFPEAMTKNNMGSGQLLFPSEIRDGIFILNGNPSRFDEVKKSPDGFGGAKGGNFLIVVCASYGSTFSADLYRTAKAFQLFKRSGTQGIDINGETIPVNDLALAAHPQQGSYAK